MQTIILRQIVVVMSKEPDTGSSLKEDRAKARWSILRNVLLEKARSSTSSSQTQQHSIHRFPGYQLVERRPADTKPLLAFLRDFHWNSENSIEDNVQKLATVCWAVAAACPTGTRIQVHNSPLCTRIITASWLDSLQTHCESTVSIIVVTEEKGTMTMWIQEKSKAFSKFSVYQYMLDDELRILTREPRETRLSLTDLVSHRTMGVDNTGNICVWDSEKTLAYLLYHHLHAFATVLSQPPRRILELGTGMAGLAAVAIAMRLVNDSKSMDTATPTPIEVTLTDGHLDGVQNNQVNQVLTKASWGADSLHLYVRLHITEKVLLWTISTEREGVEPQDLVLASDCTHFQSFHAALAVTTLRSLRVDGCAIFCQPTRADSLDNFCTLLQSVPDLSSMEWINHPSLEECDVRAKASHPGLYDTTLHYPKLLIVRKLRDLTIGDSNEFVKQQKLRETKTETTQ